MKTFLMLCLIALITGNSFAQKGTSNYLNEKGGFKCFILGEHISKYSDKVEVSKDEAYTYSVKDSTLLTIGTDIKLNFIFLKTYNDSIYSISIMAKPEYANKLRKTFIAAYGAWSYRPNQFMDKYYWLSDGNKIELFLNAENSKWCYATFKDMELDLKKGKAKHEATQEAINDL
jgi:hypothetical protein